MSIDYIVHKKQNKNSITKVELEMVENSNIVFSDIESNDNGDVTSFTASLKDSPFIGGYEFSLQEDGTYWTNTYDYAPEDFDEFLHVIQKVAESLNLVVDNPQTGEENLKPNEIYSETMNKILDMQRKVVGNMPNILAQAGINVEPIKTDLELYDDNRKQLIEIYENKGYYVDNIIWGEKDGKVQYFCSWVIGIPTILPPVDQVIILESADENSPAYIADMIDIEETLGSGFRPVYEPSMHYVVEPILNPELQEKLYKKSKKLK